MATNGNFCHGAAETFSGGPAAPESTTSSDNSNLSKDQVGWYFVEQYYNTLSKSPEKLHLFYNKKSQFVYGQEAVVAEVSVGRPVIQDRIKKLDFHDCKVRISNVDSQGSSHGEYENIVIQVIGEMSNKSEEPRKFVQTFLLAQQPTGYFVLNDILRYIDEAAEGEVSEEQNVGTLAVTSQDAVAPHDAAAEAEVVKPEESAPGHELDAAVIDKKLEEAETEPTDTTAASTAAADVSVTQESPVKTEASSSSLDPEKAAREVAEEDTKKAELPKDPSPTPVASRAPEPAAAEPEKPKGPQKPMTWASRAAAAAAAAGPKPVVPLPKIATPPASHPRVPAPATPTTQAPAAQNSAAQVPAAQAPAAPKPAETSAAKEAGSEWQSVGADSKRQGRPQSISAPLQEKDGTLGYLKYVSEKVAELELRSQLAKFGEVVYFDINRQKNCAFVEFKTPAGYQAAAAANPHVVNGEEIQLEPRRPKANAFGGSNFNNSNRGGAPGRGRGGYENRSGSHGGGRGGYGSQGRGRGGAGRGRGSAQTANA